MGQSRAGCKENTSLSAVISPSQGSHHQLPAEMGLLSFTLYSWRWRGADGPAWPGFQPDCQGGVGRAMGWRQELEYTGEREPPLCHCCGVLPLWGREGGVETSTVASLWSLNQQLLRVPWREMASVFSNHTESSWEMQDVSGYIPSFQHRVGPSRSAVDVFISKRNDSNSSQVLYYLILIATPQRRCCVTPFYRRGH